MNNHSVPGKPGLHEHQEPQRGVGRRDHLWTVEWMRHGVWIQGELALPIQPWEGFLNKSAGNPRIYKFEQFKTRRRVMFGSSLHDWVLASK